MAAPGGIAWLLQHELRLAWRGIGGKRLWIIGIGGGFLWACVHLAAMAPFLYLKSQQGVSLPPAAYLIAGGVFWLVVTLMLSQCMAHAVAALFTRGDLDLLLASPLPARRVFMVRGLAIALSSCLLPVLLLLPFAHVGAFMGRPALLWLYPVLAGVALGCAAGGMALTMSLVALLGARRAKTAAQIVAAVIGASIFLVSQAPNLLSAAQRKAFAAWSREAMAAGGVLAPESLLWWPLRALQGDAFAAALIAVAGGAAFLLVVHLTWRRFEAGSMESSDAAKVPRIGALRFRGGLARIIVVKEWKLIVRDPQVISQTLLQLLYLVPMVFIGMKSDRTAWLLVPGLVLLTAMLAGNLAWLTVTAEDAPDLIGIAPVSVNRVRWLKAAAAVLPVIVLLLPLALAWMPRDPLGATLLITCSGGAMLSSAIVQIWHPRRGDRRDMKRRAKQSTFSGFLENFAAMGWAGIAGALYAGAWPFLIPAVIIAAAGPATAWIAGREAREGVAI